MRTPDRLLSLVPEPIRSQLEKRRETVKFLIVGGTCFLITVTTNYVLKWTVLQAKPVTALIIATIIATVVSYILNREWSFNSRGGRRRHTEMTLFIVVNVIGIAINAAPEWISRYVFDLEKPHVSGTTQEIADFISGILLGTALAMFFRLWAFRRWVFPDKIDDPRGPASAGSPPAPSAGESATDLVHHLSPTPLDVTQRGRQVDRAAQGARQ